MANIIGLLSLPFGLAMGLYMGYCAYTDDLPRWMVAMFMFLIISQSWTDILLQVSKWLLTRQQ